MANSGRAGDIVTGSHVADARPDAHWGGHMAIRNDNKGLPVSSHRQWRRIRLSEWARQEGISRITAYRMLKRGILPVPYESSPTGRWYVLVPKTTGGRMAVYTRADPGPEQLDTANHQAASLARWADERHHDIFTSVSEIARLGTDRLPRLERLLLDQAITYILIDHRDVLGGALCGLLASALTPQNRALIVAHPDRRSSARP